MPILAAAVDAIEQRTFLMRHQQQLAQLQPQRLNYRIGPQPPPRNNRVLLGQQQHRAIRRRRQREQDRKPLNCLYSTGILAKSWFISPFTHSPTMAIFINQAMFFLLCDKVSVYGKN